MMNSSQRLVPFCFVSTSTLLLALALLLILSSSCISAAPSRPNREINQDTSEPDPSEIDKEQRSAKIRERSKNNLQNWENFDNGLVDEPSDLPGFGPGERSSKEMKMINPEDSYFSYDFEDAERLKRENQKAAVSRKKKPDITSDVFAMHEGAKGLDPKLVAPFQQPIQKLSADITFYSPIEQSVYKTRIQCHACRGMFNILDERIRYNPKRDPSIESRYDDNIFKSTTDLLEKIEKYGCVSSEDDGVKQRGRAAENRLKDNDEENDERVDKNDEDLLRVCRESSSVYTGLCVKDILRGCDVIQKKLREDREKAPEQSHLKTSTFNLCSAIGMCKQRF